MRLPLILVSSLLGTQPLLGQTDNDNWVRDSSFSQMDEERTYGVYRYAESPIEGVVESGRPSLVISCSSKEKKPGVAILLGQIVDGHTNAIGGTDVYVRTRLDKEKAKNDYWRASRDLSTIYPNYGPDPGRVKRFASAHAFLIEVPLYQRGAATVEFKLDGLENHLAWIGQGCGWKR